MNGTEGRVEFKVPDSDISEGMYYEDGESIRKGSF